MTTYSIADIRALYPCYDPGRYLPEGWTGTILDVFAINDCPAVDRLWVATGLVDREPGGERINRLFAVKCARRALSIIDNPDPRSIEACGVAERFANGKATIDELTVVRDAALDVARDAALVASWAAALAAAWAAALVAAWAAAPDVSRDVSRDVARAAAWAVARDAARAAAWDAMLQDFAEIYCNMQPEEAG